MFDIFEKEFNLNAKFEGNLYDLLQNFLEFQDLDIKLNKFINILKYLNGLFLDLDLIFTNYIFFANSEIDYSNFLEFLNDLVYSGEGKKCERFNHTLLDIYLGSGSEFLFEKIRKVSIERGGIKILEGDLKCSKPLVKWLEKGEIFLLKILKSNYLGNLKNGNGKCTSNDFEILLFLGFLSLYNKFNHLKSLNSNSLVLYTNETIPKLARKNLQYLKDNNNET